MYPVLPFGPLSLPTGPIFALLAIYIGLDLAARFGKRLGIHPDDIWNTGLIAVVAGLNVARLWNVVQFRHIYLDEPTLAISLRPSGFALLPGLIAALIGGYANLLRRALDPAPVAASFAVGALAAGAALNVGGYLSGSIVGIPSDLPWALPHFGELLQDAAARRVQADVGDGQVGIRHSRSGGDPKRRTGNVSRHHEIARL